MASLPVVLIDCILCILSVNPLYKLVGAGSVDDLLVPHILAVLVPVLIGEYECGGQCLLKCMQRIVKVDLHRIVVHLLHTLEIEPLGGNQRY